MAKVEETTGDLFALTPENGVLVHACNVRGQWGGGIATAFKKLYPAAFIIYREHCHNNSSLLGTTLLIPPQEGDTSSHWIACLFTSEDYGKRRGTPASILAATKTALEDLKEQLGREYDGGKKPSEVWACKFNSVSFRVPWERSRKVVEEVGVDMIVVDRE